MFRLFMVYSFVCLIFKGQFTLHEHATQNGIDASGLLKETQAMGTLALGE